MKTRKPDTARAEAPAARVASVDVVRRRAGDAGRALLGLRPGDARAIPVRRHQTAVCRCPRRRPRSRCWIGPVRPVLMFSYWVNTRISTGGHILLSPLQYPDPRAGRHLDFPGDSTPPGMGGSRKRPAAPRSPPSAQCCFCCTRCRRRAWRISPAVRSRSAECSPAPLSPPFSTAALPPFPGPAWPRWCSLFGAALLTKEQAVVLPALFLLTDIWWNPESPLRSVRANWKLYVVLAVGAAAGVALFWRLILGVGTGGSAGFGHEGFHLVSVPVHRSSAPSSSTCSTSCCRSISMWIGISRSRTPSSTTARSSDSPALLALAAVAWRYRRSFPLAGYGYFVFLVLLSPTSSILPIKDPIADRRMYLPMLGLILIAIDLLRRLKVEPQGACHGRGRPARGGRAGHARPRRGVERPRPASGRIPRSNRPTRSAPTSNSPSPTSTRAASISPSPNLRRPPAGNLPPRTCWSIGDWPTTA